MTGRGGSMKIIEKVRSRDVWPGRAWTLVTFALLALMLLAAHTYRFSDRSYREDELNTLHAARVLSPSGVFQWMAAGGFHPALWRVTATSWVSAFGDAEPVTRYFSTLLTLLTLALVYRLGTDLFDRQAGLIAALILGALPFYQFYGHELRPYSALALCTAGILVTFLRWLRHQDFTSALLYVMFGAAGLHVHYFALYVLAAQGLVFLALVRWDRGVYVRAFGLFFAIGLAYSPWVLSILHGALVTNEGGIDYEMSSSWSGFELLNQNLQGLPVFLLPGLLIPVGLVYPFYKFRAEYRVPALRFDPEWRRWYLIGHTVAILLLTFVGNLILANLTARNMMILVPALAVLGGFLIRAFQWRLRLVLVLAFVALALFVFHSYAPDIPYRQIVAFVDESYEPGDCVVTNLNHNGAPSTVMTYALLDWLSAGIPKENIFHFVEPEIRATFATPPDKIPPVYKDASPETLALFEAFLAKTDHVFFIDYYGSPLYRFTPLTETFVAILEHDFEPVREKTWLTPMPESVDADWYRITEYRRKGADE